MSRFVRVLDASALLAILNQEAGADVALPLLDQGAISAVNWSETVQKAIARGVPIDGLRTDVEGLGVTIVAFGAAEAEDAAVLWPETTRTGLSLGDRACLGLALRGSLPAVTTDRSWSSLSIGVHVHLIR